jgi:maleate isomerase
MSAEQYLPRDALGYRAKIGVVVPGTNTIVQPEYEALKPPGVTNHVMRMLLPARPYDDMKTYQQALETEGGNLEEALQTLLLCEPDAVAHGHSIHSFRGNVDRALAERDELEKFCKLPFMTPSLSLLAGLEAIGKPRNLAILTPYWPPADAMIATWFRSAGYNPVHSTGLKTVGPLSVAMVKPEAIMAAFEAINTPEVEVLIHVGTNLPVSGITEAIEKRCGKPLIGVNVATYWAALRRLGIQDRIQGFGALVRDH